MDIFNNLETKNCTFYALKGHMYTVSIQVYLQGDLVNQQLHVSTKLEVLIARLWSLFY